MLSIIEQGDIKYPFGVVGVTRPCSTEPLVNTVNGKYLISRCAWFAVCTKFLTAFDWFSIKSYNSSSSLHRNLIFLYLFCYEYVKWIDRIKDQSFNSKANSVPGVIIYLLNRSEH